MKSLLPVSWSLTVVAPTSATVSFIHARDMCHHACLSGSQRQCIGGYGNPIDIIKTRGRRPSTLLFTNSVGTPQYEHAPVLFTFGLLQRDL